MSNLGPPVFDFNSLRPVTMTIIASYDVGELNLPALFTFLPVTDQSLPAHLNFQKKQGKIRLPPELNRPGEILSMRFNKQVRGIVRSENARSFSHSIIIDIGTSERIVSVKLSRTLELTGPTSFAIAREAATMILGHVRQCQENLNFLRDHLEIALKVKQKFLHLISGGDLNGIILDSTIEKRIWDIYRQQTKGYAIERVNEFLDFMLNFNRNLYTGTLELGTFESEMVNILFNLGFSINQVAFAQIMNNGPFECKFTNAKSASAVNVFYNYLKLDRNSGQPKAAKHTIRVNRSGHVRHSGPNLESMKPVYYAFMQRVLQHHTEIQSIEFSRQQLRVTGISRSLSIKEWKEMRSREEDLRRRILDSKVPIAIADISHKQSGPEFEIIDSTLPIISLELEAGLHRPSGIIGTYSDNYVETKPDVTVSVLTFDYKPLLAVR